MAGSELREPNDAAIVGRVGSRRASQRALRATHNSLLRSVAVPRSSLEHQRIPTFSSLYLEIHILICLLIPLCGHRLIQKEHIKKRAMHQTTDISLFSSY